MAGKPCISMTARRKDAPKGARAMVKLAAAWEGRFPGSFDVRLDPEVREIVMMDGTVISGADYWLSLKDWRDGDGQRSTSTPSGEPAPTGPDGSIDVSKIPF